jgi:hypothetical protein
MRNRPLKGIRLLILLFALFTTTFIHAQSSGYINRPASSVAGRLVLDPNGDTYSSSGTSGFGNNDVTNSELPYKLIRSFSTEPHGDLRRGPSHQFSDFVPDSVQNGVYFYFSGTNLQFRFRLGSIMSGAKGYSILLDTDERFGASGASADTNYRAATTGNNGNPGFEIEIVLETNSRLAIYNVDGTSSPVLVKSYPNWQEMSQVSLAGTNDNGDPDFFLDFYIPFSDLSSTPFNLTTSSSIRLSATTVMAPQPAIGGPKSDIYGVNDNNYPSFEDAYDDYIGSQPKFRFSDFSSGGSGMKAMCTAPPVVNSPLSAGTQTVSGTWTKSTVTGSLSSATIAVYKNGILVDSVYGIASGQPWQLANVSLADNDVITAKAIAWGESMCLVSNSVTVQSCTPASRPVLPVLTCANDYGKGISGNNLSTGWVVYVENLTRGTVETSTANPAQFTVSGVSPNITWNYAGGCNGGPNMPSGTYKVYYSNGTCVSTPVMFCLASGTGASNNLAGTSAVPSITAPAALTPGTTVISGTGEPNATVILYVSGAAVKTTTASATGGFNFSGLSLVNGQQVYVGNYLTGASINTSKCYAQSITYDVNCYTGIPVITTDNNGQLAAGQPITGTSNDAAGTLVYVYTSANVLVATTPVQSNGSWSTAHASTTPAAYNAINTTTYYATAKNGSCTISAASSSATAFTPTQATRCGTITGPVAASATSVSGTVSGSFTTTTVYLYLDGVSIGSATTTGTAWGPIAVNTGLSNTLYANGVLTISVQESGKQEVVCAASATKVSCGTTPAAPVVTPSNFTISQGQSMTYTVTNAVAGSFYAIADATTGKSLGTGKWATTNGNLTLTTDAFSSSGSYTIAVKATNLSGVTVCTSTPGTAAVAVNAIILPVRFLSVSATSLATGARINWSVGSEQNVSYYEVERSDDGSQFYSVGKAAPTAGSSGTKQYQMTDGRALQGKAYYRVKEAGFDGSVNFSSVVLLASSGKVAVALLPNPAREATVLRLDAETAQVFTVEVMDGTTRVLMQKKWNVVKGANQLNIDGLSRYPKGQYLVRLYSATESFYLKLLIQ